MTSQAFDKAQDLLTAAGLAIDEAKFYESVFGSWLVSIGTDPRLRIIWDGKEGRLIVQRETSRVFSGLRVWEDLWLECRPGPESIEEAVGQLRVVARGSL
jgi:hypothetical protein